MQRRLTLTLRTNPNRIPRRTNSNAVIHTVRRTNRHFVTFYEFWYKHFCILLVARYDRKRKFVTRPVAEVS